MIHPLLDERWSPRSFQIKPVDAEILHRVFEAMRRSPSCGNEQPWRVLMGVKGEGNTWQQIFDHLDSGNQEWNSTTPVLLLMMAEKTFLKTGEANEWARYDAGQAAAHLTVQAMAEGLHVHQMAGFYGDKLQADLNIPDHYDLISVIAIGYKGEVDAIPERFRAKEKNNKDRKLMEEVLFNEASQLK